MPSKVITLRRWQVLGAFVAVVASFVVVGVLLTKQSHEIQRQRRDTAIRNCEDQNDRHDKTVAKLRKIAAEYVKAHPSSAAQIKASIKQNIELIDALAPKRNCQALANRATGG